ncbi:MAG: RNA polymerase sigma factor [Cytophagaceae bacterium]|nr:RNA polymerase sigma factor [Cytophagaceae bacterium]
MSDKELLERVILGDRKSFTALYNKFYPQVFKTAFGYFNNNFDADEIVQDVFIEVHRSAGKFNHKSGLSTWIYRITVNKSLDKLRFQKSAKRFSFFSAIRFNEDNRLTENIADTSNHGLDADNKELEKIIRKAMDTLPETQRTAFVLTQVEDLSGKEAAEIMKTTGKAVESLIQRAKANLRKELGKIYDNRRK